MYRILEQKRAEWSIAPGAAAVNFRCSLLGGAWTRANVGVAVDAAKAHAVGKSMQDWCRSQGLPKSQTFTFNKYTEVVSQALGAAWCAVLEALHGYWLNDGRMPDNVADALASLPAVNSCLELIADHPAFSTASEKLQEILSLRLSGHASASSSG